MKARMNEFGIPPGPAATNKEMREFDRERLRPWTEEELHRVRLAALALVRSHRSHDLPNGDILTAVDGRLFWHLLSALDRVRGEES